MNGREDEKRPAKRFLDVLSESEIAFVAQTFTLRRLPRLPTFDEALPPLLYFTKDKSADKDEPGPSSTTGEETLSHVGL